MNIAAQRTEKTLQAARESGWSVLVAYGNAWRAEYVRYLTDFACLDGHAVLIMAGGEMQLHLEHPGDALRARAEARNVRVVHEEDFLGGVAAAITHVCRRTGAAQIDAVLPSMLPYGIASRLTTPLNDITAAFDQLMMEKTSLEIEAVRRAAALADEGYEVFRHAARPGRMEYEVIADVEAFFRRKACPDNFMIMASGGKEVRAMHPPGTRRLQAGDLVTTELTPCIDGYYSQICRTLVIGPPSDVQRKSFDVYIEAMEAGIAAVRPGITAGDVARIENDIFRKHGLGDYTTAQYTRVRGHGLGLYVGAPPDFLEEVNLPLKAGMTVVVHPNTYHPDTGYMVLGDAVVVTSTGCEVLTQTPRQLFSVPA